MGNKAVKPFKGRNVILEPALCMCVKLTQVHPNGRWNQQAPAMGKLQMPRFQRLAELLSSLLEGAERRKRSRSN